MIKFIFDLKREFSLFDKNDSDYKNHCHFSFGWRTIMNQLPLVCKVEGKIILLFQSVVSQ